MSKFKVGDVLMCIDHRNQRLILGQRYKVSKIKFEIGRYYVATETTGDEFFFEHRFEKAASTFRGNK